ncbi:hypothetical protein E1301_Tti001486 [Triplophysa tibetana]|uniref:Uncharacterized protein n=1 Tax=Triplophysa tibetana TaxID=1572043 RepID=A0A5A9P7J0_9TELE|nr:hypothetical protein E1301_Tti001486 [Triplophysa tibetana]
MQKKRAVAKFSVGGAPALFFLIVDSIKRKQNVMQSVKNYAKQNQASSLNQTSTQQHASQQLQQKAQCVNLEEISRDEFTAQVVLHPSASLAHHVLR